MSLKKHAEAELKLLNHDDEYELNMHKCVLDLIDLFSLQEHSGYSANWVRSCFNELAQFKNLTNIKKSDFMEVAENVFQCTRNPAFFWDGKTDEYYHVDDKAKMLKFIQ